jgi:hypothetical protein
MADIFDKIDKLTNAHNYFGKAKTISSSIDKVLTATKIDPHDTAALNKLVGLGNAEAEKLRKKLSARASATKAASVASYPKVPSQTTKYWTAWANALKKHGTGSKKADGARKNYQWSLEQYDKKLEERLGYCGALIVTAEKQIKLYANLRDVHARGVRIAEITLKAAPSSEAQTAALTFLLEFGNLGGSLNAIVANNKKIVKNAKKEKARIQPLKDHNMAFLQSMRDENLTKHMRKAFKAAGLAYDAWKSR